ncbi:N-acetyltransferase family protein [Knoellia sp. CPCC 206435]|uniref:GNAT family N-acetyltransferase n=1 Tax=Knoellia terrae TaxID=3404797 RepID=UPI003B435E1D
MSLDEARSWWLETPPGVTVVACSDDGTLLGSAKAGPNRPGRGSHVATASFMVTAAARRRGVGRALGKWALDWAREQGYAAMQFNAVAATNTVAVARWQELGFTVIGIVPEAFDSASHGRVGLHVMHRHLEA